MQPYYELTLFLLAFIFIVFVLFIIITAFCSNVLLPFIRKKNYIKMEMARSEGREYDYWKRKLRRHYIGHIPVVGNLIIRFMR